MPEERSVENVRQFLRQVIEGVPGLKPPKGEEMLRLEDVKGLTDWEVVQWAHYFVTWNEDAFHVYESRFGVIELPKEDVELPVYNPATGFFTNHDPWAPHG